MQVLRRDSLAALGSYSAVLLKLALITFTAIEHADVVLEVDKPSSDSADLVTAPSEQDCIDRAVQESLQESLQEQVTVCVYILLLIFAIQSPGSEHFIL